MDDALTPAQARMLAKIAAGDTAEALEWGEQLSTSPHELDDVLLPMFHGPRRLIDWLPLSAGDCGIELTLSGWAALKRYSDECSSKECVT